MREQQAADELIMGLTERECRSALLMLAHATTSLTGGDDDGDGELNATQAAIAEHVALVAIREVLIQTRGLAAATPGLEVGGRILQPVRPTKLSKRDELPDIIA